MDEAGYVGESYMPLLALFPHVERILCFGDSNQLPPFTRQPSNLKQPPLPSFLRRCESRLAEHQMELPMLKTQFRMQHSIAHLVSSVFYKGKLQSDPDILQVRAVPFAMGQIRLSGTYWLDCSKRVVQSPPNNTDTAKAVTKAATKGSSSGGRVKAACDIAGAADDERTLEWVPPNGSGLSFVNLSEISHIVHLLKVLHYNCQDFFGQKSVLIIAFYRQQADFLKKNILCAIPECAPALDAGMLRIQTVDSSQGCEADIVIISCVRSNARNELGFLHNHTGANRMCVAVSRAREALVVVGDHRIMKQLPAFRMLWESANNGGATATTVGPMDPQRTMAARLVEPPLPCDAINPTPAEAFAAKQQKKSLSKAKSAPAPAARDRTTPAPQRDELQCRLLRSADDLTPRGGVSFLASYIPLWDFTCDSNPEVALSSAGITLGGASHAPGPAAAASDDDFWG